MDTIYLFKLHNLYYVIGKSKKRRFIVRGNAIDNKTATSAATPATTTGANPIASGYYVIS